MTAIFEFIKSNFAEFIALFATLGVSVSGLYALVKKVVTIFTAKAKQVKQATYIKSICLEVLAPLFLELKTQMTTENEYVNNYLDSLNAVLLEFQTYDIRAYINTVLTQKGNEELRLSFEQAKSALIAAQPRETPALTEEEGENIETEEPVDSVEVLEEEKPKESVYV